MTMSISRERLGGRISRFGTIADCVGFAASPSFALMAWVASHDASVDFLCSSTPSYLPIDGMVWMY